MKYRYRVLAPALIALAASFPAFADTFPNKPIKLIVPVPPGGTSDFMARQLADQMSKSIGQAVIVENRPGANQTIAGLAVMRAPADGYTLLLGSFAMVVNPFMVSTVPYRYTDFDSVSLMAYTPNVLLAGPSAGAANVKDILAQAKASPGKVTYASTSPGGSPHLSGALFNSMAKVDTVHVPFNGASPAMTALLGGHVNLMFDNLPTALAQIRGGKVKALAVTTKNRVPVIADVPTLDESGLKGYEVNAWFGVFAPKGTPPQVVNLIATEVRKAVNQPDLREKFHGLGAVGVGSTPMEFASTLKSETAKWEAVIKEAGIKVE
ncbi:MAG: tripartite tricarboxylate transporter substrate binding protein [Polaromonas sp.]|nr:tripartite tricarboxylate transporter substrate binding protein [Polaromonas sp.]